MKKLQAPCMTNEERVNRTKNMIFDAVIKSLDEFGYSETSINKIQNLAGVSRGALTHHFPSKEDMIVETLQRILKLLRGVALKNDELAKNLSDGVASYSSDFKDDLRKLWKKIVDTEHGRALVEILVAARTDKNLRRKISPSLIDYNFEINSNIRKIYSVVIDPNISGDIALYWTICRTFLQGIHIQERFERDPKVLSEIVDKFADIMMPYFQKRSLSLMKKDV